MTKWHACLPVLTFQTAWRVMQEAARCSWTAPSAIVRSSGAWWSWRSGSLARVTIRYLPRRAADGKKSARSCLQSFTWTAQGPYSGLGLTVATLHGTGLTRATTLGPITLTAAFRKILSRGILARTLVHAQVSHERHRFPRKLPAFEPCPHRTPFAHLMRLEAVKVAKGDGALDR